MFTDTQNNKIQSVEPILPEDGEIEIWKDIPDWEGKYQVSSFGRVRGLDRYVEYKSRNGKITKGMVKGLVMSNHGRHVQVHLFHESMIYRTYAHILVGKCFHTNPLNLPVINHKDGNPRNNYYKNLEWCTVAYNNQHAYDTGLKKCTIKLGKDHHRSKKIVQLSKNDDFIKYWDNALCVERELGFSASAIRSCLLNKTKTSNGFKWEYQ